ncbi:phosphotransferase [Deinococcus sp. QL22]|uniref:phosphotransferase n=1 Tax=Deinococcus sp. QL22 TaxID=2939437 RepID=UPI002017F64F|nr:phosphotransferase [Deinococcus sp. QL22]UQN06962.1 aminoglycoside phosphotransferase family protein [Deinococcus sp. QL22]
MLRQAGEWPMLPAGAQADLLALIRAEWNLETWLLHDGGLSFGLEGMPRLQALSDFLPDGWAWAVAAVPPLPGAREWQRLGWFPVLKARLEGVLSEYGLPPAGLLKLLSSNDLGMVVEAATSSDSVFLKVTAHPREVAVTAHLAQQHPALLPPVLHADAATATLVTSSGGILLDGVGNLEAWTAALRQLANFQTAADAPALATLGCPAFPLLDMAQRVDAFLSDTVTLTDWGLKPEKIATLQAARPVIRASFGALAAHGLPDLPAHGDAHPRNALTGVGESLWFDWSEAASAAHPFMDAGWFLAFALHPARAKLPIRIACPDLESRLSTAYLQTLGCPDASVLLAQSIPLALLHRAVLYDARFRDWHGTVPNWRPQYVPYYLGLAAREVDRLPRLTR